MRLTTAIVCLLLPTTALAVPTEVSHQGRLFDSVGTPLDGSHDLTFNLYQDATGTSSIWSEALTGVNFDNGYYVVTLGETSALDDGVLDGQSYYLGLSVDGGAEAPNRISLLSAPYAIRAGTADTATAVSGGVVNATEVQINGTTVIDGSGNVSAPVDWSSITNAPAGLDDGDADSLAALSCADGQVVKVVGGTWDCGDDVDTDTNVDALVALGCSDDEIPKMVSGAWACVADADPVTSIEGSDLTLAGDVTLTGDTVITTGPGQRVYTTLLPTFTGSSGGAVITCGSASCGGGGCNATGEVSSACTNTNWHKVANLNLNGNYSNAVLTMDIMPRNGHHGDSRQRVNVALRNSTSNLEADYEANVEWLTRSESPAVRDVRLVRSAGTGVAGNVVGVWVQFADSWNTNIPVEIYTTGGVALTPNSEIWADPTEGDVPNGETPDVLFSNAHLDMEMMLANASAAALVGRLGSDTWWRVSRIPNGASVTCTDHCNDSRRSDDWGSNCLGTVHIYAHRGWRTIDGSPSTMEQYMRADCTGTFTNDWHRGNWCVCE